MTLFRACIDIHAGQVKQIVGGTLTVSPPPPSSSSFSSTPLTSSSHNTEQESSLKTNYISPHPPSHFSSLYKTHNLRGAHVIMLGPGNEAAAREALAAWPGGLQVGGGINDKNALQWIESGAEKVIVTSFLFPGGVFDMGRLRGLVEILVGGQGEEEMRRGRERVVVDLSCRRVRRKGGGGMGDGDGEGQEGKGDGKGEGGREGEVKWVVATEKWTRLTDFEINAESIATIEPYCSELLIHAADNEGLQRGIDEELVAKLGEWCTIPVTYAGGGKSIEDLALVKRLSIGRVDLTIGSALDIFGGKGVRFEDVVEWNRREEGEI